jgi:hypothetical protein
LISSSLRIKQCNVVDRFKELYQLLREFFYVVFLRLGRWLLNDLFQFFFFSLRWIQEEVGVYGFLDFHLQSTNVLFDFLLSPGQVVFSVSIFLCWEAVEYFFKVR